MVNLSLLITTSKVQTFGSFPLAIGLFVSISVLISLCAKHSRKSIKLSTKSFTTTNNNINDDDDLIIPPRSPLRSAKQLIASISDKAMPFIHHRKNGVDYEDEDEDVEKAMAADENEGVWRKAILMGEKCQPPDFSGVIYYDYEGKRIAEMPKSPRAANIINGGGGISLLPTSFSFPVVRAADNNS